MAISNNSDYRPIAGKSSFQRHFQLAASPGRSAQDDPGRFRRCFSFWGNERAAMDAGVSAVLLKIIAISASVTGCRQHFGWNKIIPL
jgi:hypothetical protein